MYHLSYQEELWAEDDEKAEAKTKSKKNKKQKKKAKKKNNATPVDAKNPRAPKMEPETAKPDQIESSSATKEVDVSENSTSPLTVDNKLESKQQTSRASSGGTIDDESASGGGVDNIVEEAELPENNNEESIDLVLYLQQTGSIIALAKLMDSLYADEDLDDEDEEELKSDKGLHQGSDLKHNMARLSRQ